MTALKWHWQQDKWPNFTYDKEALLGLELAFIQSSAMALGALKHVSDEEKDQLLIEVLSDEAMKTSEIEGEYLNRDSIQESIKKNLGLAVEIRKLPAAEFGISEMMVNLYQTYDEPLTDEYLFEWHKMLTNGRRDLVDIGRYRTHEDPMQIVSGVRMDKKKVHYEAPPSNSMAHEMKAFIDWFNKEHSKGVSTNSLLAKSGIAHFYFLAVHPFEDGNGRIARAISEKSLSISLGRPALISLSQMIQSNKKAYYESLGEHNMRLDLTEWLLYFGQTVIDAQNNTLQIIEFLIQKAKFFDRFAVIMNERQTTVVRRIFREGHHGFKGGLSAENYTRIAKTSASTATRDLKDLVNKNMLFKTGKLKSTRYYLNLKS
ncbi:MAG: Fic family protein [Flavobacteriaceae bacterium]|nr:Fic family protein [Flavobacteriaceae bacterium]